MRSRKEALVYLQGQGWKVSQSTFYAHVGQGKVAAGKHGFTRTKLDAYAQAFLKPADVATVEDAGPLVDVQQGKLAAQTRNMELKNQKDELLLARLRGELIPRTALEDELAARALLFRAGLERFGRESGPTVAALFGGEPREAARLVGRIREAATSEEAAALLVSESEKRVPEFAAMWLELVEGLLEPYTREGCCSETMEAVLETGEVAL